MTYHYVDGMKIINLTPHRVSVIFETPSLENEALGDENVTNFDSDGVARVATSSELVCRINGIPVVTTAFGEVTGLPAKTNGTYYIVSRIVKQAVPDRDDCLCPGELVRDEKGQPIGCKGFSL